MLCNRCHQREATVFLTKIVNGEKSQYHLCEVCAKEQGEIFSQAAQGFHFNNLLSGLLNMESSPVAAPSTTALRCDSCGMTYQQFTQIGRFGCPECYHNFAARLEPLLRRIQSSSEHTGKVPLRCGEQVKLKQQLETLRRDLKQAVMLEQFEEAARLRDEIRDLEQRMDATERQG